MTKENSNNELMNKRKKEIKSNKSSKSNNGNKGRIAKMLRPLFYMYIGAECLRIDKACMNQNSFLNSINPLLSRMISQGANKCRIAKRPLKFFTKHQSNFKHGTKTKKGLLAII